MHLGRKKPCKVLFANIAIEDLQATLSGTPHGRKMDGKDEEIKLLKKRIKELEDIQQKTVNNIQNIQININHCKMNDFGQETLDHITDEFIENCIIAQTNGVVQLIEKIHFDPGVPQNRNIRFQSNKQKTMKVVKNGEWKLASEQAVLNDMLKKSGKIMQPTLMKSKNPKISLEANEIEHGRLSDMLCDFAMDSGGRKPSMAYFDIRKKVKLLIMDNTEYYFKLYRQLKTLYF